VLSSTALARDSRQTTARLPKGEQTADVAILYVNAADSEKVVLLEKIQVGKPWPYLRLTPVSHNKIEVSARSHYLCLVCMTCRSFVYPCTCQNHELCIAYPKLMYAMRNSTAAVVHGVVCNIIFSTGWHFDRGWATSSRKCEWRNWAHYSVALTSCTTSASRYSVCPFEMNAAWQTGSLKSCSVTHYVTLRRVLNWMRKADFRPITDQKLSDAIVIKFGIMVTPAR
jgi:hypothetical protein